MKSSRIRNVCLLLAAIISALPLIARAADEPSLPAVVLPTIPDKTFTITDYGAVGDGKTMNTAAIQKTIDAASAAGGGKVVVPPGKFLTAPFHLASSINLNLPAGATILFSNNRADFKLTTAARYEDCITAPNCHDVAITGAGTIDGQGEPWWAAFRDGSDNRIHRPFMIVINSCQRLLVQGVTLTNSPMFHLVPQRCQNVTIDGIHIQAPARAPNTDGIDPSGFDFVFKNCVFDVGDDCIAIKPGGKIDPNRASCENFLITDCTFNHGHGMSIGGQTPGGLKHLIVRNSTFDSTDSGIRMKSPLGQGGLVEDCLYENLTMKNVTWPISISSYYSEGTAPRDLTQATTEAVTNGTPIWRNIRITNVTSTSGPNAGRIYGLPEMHISDITFTNVHIIADKPLIITQADNLKFLDSTITVANGDAITAIVADIKGLDPKTGK